ncbi:MAG: hypothetical protein P8Z30_01340 [Acidobacteriota bacterium]
MKNWRFCLILLGPCLILAQAAAVARPSQQNASTSQAIRPIGRVTKIQAGQLTLHTDAGPNLTVNLPDGVSVLEVGDRVLILGPVSADHKSVQAKTVIVMNKTALAKAHAAEVLAWEKRGLSGVVKAVDPASKEITLSVPNTLPKPGNLTHPMTVTLASNAVLLRYAPDSVKFSDAKPAPFADIKVGDQVRALGTKSADGTHFTAEKLVSGTFRNIGATVISVDASQGTITVKDLATGKPLLVRTNASSQLHELTPRVAGMIAMFNSGGGPQNATPGQKGAGPPREMPQRANFQGHGRPGGAGAPGERGGMPGGGPPAGNFNEMLSHMPPLSLSQLKAGEPLIVVSTEGAKPSEVTAIAVLSGVEPILRARPKGSKQVALGPWNMSTGGGGGGEEGGGNQGP